MFLAPFFIILLAFWYALLVLFDIFSLYPGHFSSNFTSILLDISNTFSFPFSVNSSKDIPLIEQIGILPEFVKSSLDEEESSHIDYDDDFRQVLIIFDYPSAENEDDDSIDSTYSTLPIGIVILKGYVVTISLYENWSILEMSQGRIKGMDTRLKSSS